MAIISMKKQNGFVLAFSLLISSIVLALALGIFNILLKQIVLTSTAAESQVAFYAADAGAECALYWDTHHSRPVNDINAFDASGNYLYSYRGVFNLGPGFPDIENGDVTYVPQTDIACGPDNISFNSTLDGISRFEFAIGNSKCVKVTIIKQSPIAGTSFDTRIESLGYNVPCAAIGGANANRVVERAIRVQY